MNGNPINRMKAPFFRILIGFLIFFLIVYTWSLFLPTRERETATVSYSLFLEQLEAGNVDSVTIDDLHVTGLFKEEVAVPLPDVEEPADVKAFETHLPRFQGEELIATLRDRGVVIEVTPADERSVIRDFLVGILPWVIIIGIWILILRQSRQVMGGGPGGLFSFSQSRVKLFDVKRPHVTFRDVAGMENEKRELEEVVDFLKHSDRFRKIGAKVPKGILLVGHPGTGKTLLARATAGEAGVPFYSINASEFIEMFVGVGAARVRDMFQKAKSQKPSLVFIDEIDAVGRTRGAGLGGGHDEREQTLNQLLAEMDGFEPNEGVIVLAATNRPDVLDPALLRPGRFDRRIVIGRPGLSERKAILEIHVRDKKLSEDVDLDRIARGTPGMTGADLENLANEAALTAVRKNKDRIQMSDFEEARDRILMGTVRGEIISDLERRITAYHEAGHALVAWELPGTDPIHKVSITPRGLAMGATQMLPEEDRHYFPKSYLLNRLSVALAGRAAEKLVFHDVSTGAQNDLKEATSLAEKMVAQWGMSDRVGPINLGRAEEHPFLGRELAAPKRYSEDMAWLMDQEIRKLVLDAEGTAEGILRANREILDRLAEALLEKETLERSEIERIIRNAKSDPDSRRAG
jgi:cell division protease FtsH